MFRNILILNLFFGIFLSKVSCSIDILETVCKTDKDCDSYEDKTIKSECVEPHCKCSVIKTGDIVICEPKNLIKENTIGRCPCRIPNTVCNQTINKCFCKTGFMESSDEQRCISEIVNLDRPCEINEQCLRADPNANCINRSCACKKGFQKHEEACFSIILTSTANKTCDSDEICQNTTVNSICIKNSCVCKENSVYFNQSNSCLAYAKFHEPCVDTVQCKHGIHVGTVCNDGFCRCDEQHEPFLDNGVAICRRKIYKGDPCKEHNDCAPYYEEPSMMCEQSKCVCRPGYELYDSYSRKCVKIQKFRSSASSKISCNFFAVSFIFVLIISKFI